MQLTHLLFTRFNIQYEPNDTIGIQPEWLDERLRLFELYCMPSIKKQTCQDFIWILLGDIRTADIYKEKIEKYKNFIPQIRTYWFPYQEDGYHSCYKQIAHELAKDADILVSTRLDSDDAFPENYVETVQDLARNGMEGIVSFPIGKQTFIHDRKSYKIRYIQNHSTSRIERSGFETIMVFDHTQVDTHAIHIIENKEPMWEEIVHGGNMLNDYVPKYHYYITCPADVWDLSKRWARFQFNRLVCFWKRHFVLSDKG